MNIQWNTVTWYSKLLALALFVALPFIGFYYGTQYGKTLAVIERPPAIVATSTTDAAAAYYNNPAEWQTDANNTAGGFSIAYPLDFDAQDNNSVAPSIDWRYGSNNVKGIKYFTLTVPRAFEPQTNFVDATLTVGASKSGSAIADCLKQDPNGESATATSSVTIDGVVFTVFKSADAAAGSIFETTSYRTVHGGSCYAVEYTVHSSQIANYPESYGLKPFNANKINSVMQTVIGTFKFT